MLDSFGRSVDYLRVSITQRCNLHCMYCGAAQPDPNELSPADLERIIRIFTEFGIKKVRVTGGEPLLRADLFEILERIRGISAVEKLALTTNGIGLEKKVEELKKLGVDAVNISLDCVDRDIYRTVTGFDASEKALGGLYAALKAGIPHVRVNCVLLRGINDGQAASIVGLAREHPVDVRFIELMPFSDKGREKNLIVTSDELRQRFPELQSLQKETTDGIAAYYSAPGFRGRVGFISPITGRFCDTCSRIRLLSNGRIRPCLASEMQFDLLPVLNDERKIRDLIEQAILLKPAGHRFGCANEELCSMNQIGG